MNLLMDKETLLKRLEAVLKETQAEDARKTKAHVADERATLKKFHAACRDALRWDYEALKKNSFQVRQNRPSCPIRESAPIERLIRVIKLDTRTVKYRLTPSSDLYIAVTWLPESKRPKQTVCD